MPEERISVERTLGELLARVDMLHQAQDKHEAATAAMHADVVELKLKVMELKSEGAHGIGIVRHTITAAIAAIAGMFGGHVPLPGAH